MDITDKTRAFLATRTETPGEVLHTLDAGQPLRATRTESGWDLEPEGWVHS